MAIHNLLIVTGSALTLCGLFALIWCVLAALRAKRAQTGDEAMQARLRKVLIVNMGALGISALGLVLVVSGIILAP